jgi:predicted ATP-grasp superfamily ATP-dependent carboligase
VTTSVAVRRLVVLGDSITALAVARDGARRGLEVHLVTSDRGIATHTRAARVHRVGDVRDEGPTVHLLSELAGAAPSALIVTSDGWLRFLMRRRVEVDAAFHSVLHPDNAILTICLDKARSPRVCRTRTQHRRPSPDSMPPRARTGVSQ